MVFPCQLSDAKWMTSELLLWHLTWHGHPILSGDWIRSTTYGKGLADWPIISRLVLLLVRLAGLRLGGKSTSAWFVQDQVQPNQIT